MRESIILFSLFFFIVVFAFGVVKHSAKESVLSTYLVFCIGVVVYFMLIPFEAWIKGAEIIYIAGYEVDVGSHIVFVFIQSALAVPAFMFGLQIGGFGFYSLRDISYSELNVKKRQAVLALVFMLAILVIYAEYIFLSSNDYFNTASLQYSDPLYSLLKYVAVSLLCFYGLLFFLKGQLIVGFLFVAIVFIFGIFTNDKNPMLMSLLALGAYAVRNIRGKISTGIFFCIMFPLVFLLLFMVRLFSLWRAGYTLLESTSMAIASFSFANIDPAGPYISISKSFNIGGFDFGYTYIQNSISLIPRAIYPTRPPDLSEGFAREVMSDWSEGRGLGFSPLAEAYINFGYLAFIYFFLFGLIWALQWRVYCFLWRKLAPANVFPVFYKIFGLYMLLLSFRGSSLHLLKIMPMYFLASLFVVFIFQLSVRKRHEGFVGSQL